MQKTKILLVPLPKEGLSESAYGKLDWAASDQVAVLGETQLETASAPIANYQWNDANVNTRWLILVNPYLAPSTLEIQNISKHFVNLLAERITWAGYFHVK